MGRDLPFHNEEAVEEGAPAWVVTFGDLMSLLLCFFVLLLSFSEMDRQKYKELSGSMMNAFGVQRKKQVFEVPSGQKIIAKDFDQDAISLKKDEGDILEEVRRAIEENFQDMAGLIELKGDGQRIKISLMGESTFDSGSAEIRASMRPLLEKIAVILMESQQGITIVGHTDNVPVKKGSAFKSNLHLSMARAASVAEFLFSRGLVTPDRVSTMGYGEYRPIDTNHTRAGRQKNRRVEIILGEVPLPDRMN